jgi:4-aminobutyrate aminotransferase
MFASQHDEVRPDIVTLAKGLGSGMPIGLVIAKKRHMEKWGRGAHGNTYGGNPVCCAAALATIDLVQGESRTMRRWSYLLERLHEMQTRFIHRQVRGKGRSLVSAGGAQTCRRPRSILSGAGRGFQRHRAAPAAAVRCG